MNINIEIKDNTADPKKRPKYNISSLANTISLVFVVHKLNTKINPAEIPAATNK
ncbi:hypothetical protein JCM19300_4288 [Algibacter lectus]|uniref:Uncharacterized protein n=1 Tax=Algibacter lectus TaxID=221126 RepID=A0A090W1D6_9FLAO|nr:hypothetical protein JCM19300_4288 [Algibacter lectus]GAL79420.1 hypothetical protein JCM19274_1928 [Algibacter lectus]